MVEVELSDGEKVEIPEERKRTVRKKKQTEKKEEEKQKADSDGEKSDEDEDSKNKNRFGLAVLFFSGTRFASLRSLVYKRLLVRQ